MMNRHALWIVMLWSSFTVIGLCVLHVTNCLQGIQRFTYDAKAKTTARACEPAGAGVLSPVPLTPTVLHSYPGSGDNWLRRLLTAASGIVTGSMHETTMGLKVAGKRAERVIAVTSHRTPKATRSLVPAERSLLLIRNPYEALLEEFCAEILRGSDDLADWGNVTKPHASFQTALSSFISKHARTFHLRYVIWAKDPSPTHVVVYHRLKDDPGQELAEIFDFLNESSITPRLHCAVQHEGEGIVRTDRVDLLLEAIVFTEREKQILNNAIDKIQFAVENKTWESYEDFQWWKR